MKKIYVLCYNSYTYPVVFFALFRIPVVIPHFTQMTNVKSSNQQRDSLLVFKKKFGVTKNVSHENS